MIVCPWFVREIWPHRPMVAVTNRTSSALRTECGGRWWLSSKAAAPNCQSVHRCAGRPAGRREPGQFAALTAREYEVAPGAGPLRAIAVRPQVALPANRALVAAGLIDAHLAHRSPAGSRPGRDTLSAAAAHRPAGQRVHFAARRCGRAHRRRPLAACPGRQTPRGPLPAAAPPPGRPDRRLPHRSRGRRQPLATSPRERQARRPARRHPLHQQGRRRRRAAPHPPPPTAAHPGHPRPSTAA